jgi:major membrane immunogen (membrane-anchored lipoprotein)
MRRITLAMVSTIAGLVLLFSYRTSTSGPGGGSTAAPVGIVGPASGAAASAAPPASGGSPATTPGSGTLTINGSAVDDGFGVVQVQVKISAGKIVDVSTLSQPQDGHSQRINSVALPQLRREVLNAQSANIDTVGGATVTSEAYAQSLQAALDAAHLN